MGDRIMKTEVDLEMKEQIKVDFLFPGSFFSENETKVVKSRDPEKVKVPDGCFAFSFYDLIVTTVILPSGKKIVDYETKNRSKKFYPDAKIYSLQEIKEMKDNGNKILISNMECNHWDRVVRTRSGNYQPLEKGDRII